MAGTVNSVVMTVSPGARSAARQRLAAWLTLTRVQDLAMLRTRTDALMGLSWLLLSQAPALLRIARLSLAEAVRTRS